MLGSDVTHSKCVCRAMIEGTMKGITLNNASDYWTNGLLTLTLILTLTLVR